MFNNYVVGQPQETKRRRAFFLKTNKGEKGEVHFGGSFLFCNQDLLNFIYYKVNSFVPIYTNSVNKGWRIFIDVLFVNTSPNWNN